MGTNLQVWVERLFHPTAETPSFGAVVPKPNKGMCGGSGPESGESAGAMPQNPLWLCSHTTTKKSSSIFEAALSQIRISLSFHRLVLSHFFSISFPCFFPYQLRGHAQHETISYNTTRGSLYDNSLWNKAFQCFQRVSLTPNKSTWRAVFRIPV